MRKFDFIFSVIFLVVFFLFGLLCLGDRGVSFDENKFLVKRPKLQNVFASDQMDLLETSFQDQFLYRSRFLEYATNVKRYVGVKESNGVFIGNDGYLLEQTQRLTDPKKLVSSLNDFYKSHNDLNMSLLLIPSHITIRPDLVQKGSPIFDEYAEMKSLYRQISFNTIDVVDTLKEHSKEYDMYYHLDSHLTSYGAYYVYQKYASSNDFDFMTMDRFHVEVVTDSFIGDLAQKSYLFSLKKDTMVTFVPENVNVDRLYFDEFLETNHMYDYFLGNHSLVSFVNESQSNEVLVVKDDDANALIPFLVNHYYHVHVIDVNRYTDSISDYLNDHKEIKEVLFVYGINGLEKVL